MLPDLVKLPIKQLAMHQISNENNRKLMHRTNEHQNLLDMLTRFSRDGQCNSVIVSGPPGSGKSALVQSVLQEAGKQRDFAGSVIVVQLHGLEHFDDRSTLQAIARTLRVESDLEGRIFSGTNEQLHFIISLLQSGNTETLRVLFVLEEFDLFAQRKGQSLLYTLLDVAQSRVVPVCLLGVTSRVSVGELLEKRVKSRFSHRHIRLRCDWTLDEYVAVALSLLHLSERAPTGVGAAEKNDFKRRVGQWNSNIDSLLRHDENCRSVLVRHLQIYGGRPKPLINLLSVAVALLPDGESLLTAEDFKSAQQSMLTELALPQLCDLSIVELCLLVAANHIDNGHRPVSFESVYTEYVRFCQSKMPHLQYERDLIRRAFDSLLESGLMAPASDSAGCGDLGGVALGKREEFVCLVPPEILVQGVNQYPNRPEDVRQWAARCCKR
ncbi:hypothetical protein BOX15_Mlig033679g2 [Macrostomum lignano]|uniref:Uncharacterized protein n=2 Tax=Macrostomum lignano TaxID=282301 RepID=A0A267G1A3_9PLAT|nr:hypothetical protein BOX15_Mlig033679g2 [Macrostomum lignano]